MKLNKSNFPESQLFLFERVQNDFINNSQTLKTKKTQYKVENVKIPNSSDPKF